ncbi:SH3 domain-containing protein [Streptomyces sp. NRRL WC-3742]|uniref:SH3 domain-containing protein n=1 Tax=Streptomyces sp. NRRL WC-3742 TaxID=1463934 RepID=UPI00068DD4D6|nr:SH3 domain-containing protein [Streptomyces sp. NRRL WC-3742]
MPRFPSRRRGATSAVVVLAASAVLLATAPTAGARTLGPYSVTAYETVNIRTKPTTSSRAFGQVRAGETRTDAMCWTHGETVRDHGYTNDVWIGFTEGWASAVYLKGNEYAGLPADATC